MSNRGQLLVSMRRVSKVFHTGETETQALSKIDLDVYRGEYVSVAGPSGCGKSTLLSLIGFLDTASDGQYSFDGQDISDLSFAERTRLRCKHVGFIFQNFNLIDDITVFENVALPLVYQGLPTPTIRERATAAIEKVGMSSRMKHYPSQLSGGQQQRVAVARAVAGEPSILLADEPTGNLDSKTSEEILRLFQELNSKKGITIILVTHDPKIADHAKRIIRISDGIIEGQNEGKV
jgi:putative ABC transport system ATP-binding protein